MSQRFDKDTRRGIIVTAAVAVIKEAEHPMTVDHATVARACAVPTSESTVRSMFSTKRKLWQAAAAADPDVMKKLKMTRVL